MDLFEKTSIKGMSLKNRFFRAATWERLATDTGHMTDKLFEIYENLAKGGVSTIITGYSHVIKDEHPNPNMMGIYEDSFISEYRKLTDMVHGYKANIIMQIVYGGSMSDLNPPCENIMGPSSVKNERTGIIPIEMTKYDIIKLIDIYSEAALRVKQAGFDGVELQAAHGYMLSQFLCPYYNRRKDEYGGTIENRARIIVEIIQAIRKTVGEDFPILIKINSEDFMEDGLTSEESIEASKIFKKAGIDAIEVSGGNGSSPKVLKGNLAAVRTEIAISKDKESYFAKHASLLAREVNIPVILTGGNRHFDVMEEILNTTGITYYSFSRPLISEPNLIKRWESGNREKPRCISCNKCFNPNGIRCIYK